MQRDIENGLKYLGAANLLCYVIHVEDIVQSLRS